MSSKNGYPSIYHTKPRVYPIIFSLWLFIMIIFEYFTIKNGIIPTLNNNHPFYAALIGVNQIFVGMFFYFGLTNLVFPLRYEYIKKDEKKQELKILNTAIKGHPKVQLLYTTYNDFMPYAFEQCLQQTYDVTGVILDNSTDQKVIDKIKQFVSVNPGVKWIRNKPNGHAKAGNLTEYLNGPESGDYDYFVILDADELIEPHFVEKAIKFFQTDANLGVLQANHISGCNTNQFMDTFSKAANSFWPVQNTVRSTESGSYSKVRNNMVTNHRVGDTLCIGLGHGVMVSKDCYQSIGQFPYVVAEDLSFSFEALINGFNIKFASQIYGNEQFPINMQSLGIRSSKFCSANFQFFKVYGKRLFTTKLLSTFQKLDLISFTLSVPIFAINYLSLIISSIIFPLAGINQGNQAFMLVPTLLCYFSQSLSDVIFQFHKKQPILGIISYAIQSIILYGGAYYLTVKCTFLAIVNVPAKFNVTPKDAHKITVKDVFMFSWEGVVFSILTIIVCMLISGSSWILLSFFPGVIGFTLSFKANKISPQNQLIIDQINQANKNALSDQKHSVVDWRL